MEVLLSKAHVLALAEKKGLTKKQFAELLGIKKQNLNSLLDSHKKDINTIIKMAEVLEIPFLQFIGLEQPDEKKLDGYIKKGGKIYEIKTEDDILRLLLSDKIIAELKRYKYAFEHSYGKEFSNDKLMEQLMASVEEGDCNVYEQFCQSKTINEENS